MKTILSFLILCAFAASASATNSPPPKPVTPVVNEVSNSIRVENELSAHLKASSASDALSTSDSYSFSEGGSAGADASATGGDASTQVSVNASTRGVRSAPGVALVPNNNTESCLRVFGFGGSGINGSAVFGVPFRSKECDLQRSADDAFAQGNLVLGWSYKCKMKANRNAFGSEQACLDAALVAMPVTSLEPIAAPPAPSPAYVEKVRIQKEQILGAQDK